MILRKLCSIMLSAMFVCVPAFAAAQQADSLQHINFSEDTISLEFIGNVNNSGPNSNQFGYFSFVSQLPAFNGAPETAGTANFTFYTEAVTQRVTNNGTLRIVDRIGITTVYLTSSPASFADPESFRSGTPIQTSTMQQQVILDTTTGDFSVVNINTVTDAPAFYLSGQQYQLGKVGSRFRTLLRGKTNAAAPPGFYMAGYAVGIGKD